MNYYITFACDYYKYIAPIIAILGMWFAWNGWKQRRYDCADKLITIKVELEAFINTLIISFYPKTQNEAFGWLHEHFKFLYEWKINRWYIPKNIYQLRCNVSRKSIEWICKIEQFYSSLDHFNRFTRPQIHISPLPNEIPNSGDTTSDLYKYRDSWDWSGFQSFINTYRSRLNFGFGNCNPSFTLTDVEKELSNLYELYKEKEVLRTDVMLLSKELLNEMENNLSSPIRYRLYQWRNRINNSIDNLHKIIY